MSRFRIFLSLPQIPTKKRGPATAVLGLASRDTATSAIRCQPSPPARDRQAQCRLTGEPGPKQQLGEKISRRSLSVGPGGWEAPRRSSRRPAPSSMNARQGAVSERPWPLSCSATATRVGRARSLSHVEVHELPHGIVGWQVAEQRVVALPQVQRQPLHLARLDLPDLTLSSPLRGLASGGRGQAARLWGKQTRAGLAARGWCLIRLRDA
jgi:hypothetical protein